MPANLTPQYHKAEQAYKDAKTVEEKIACLEEMLSVMPKHKGTDHLQADLKRKLSKHREELAKPKSGGKKAFDPFRLEKGGAGQVVVLGAPNAGKSALVAALTKAATEPTPFPFATQGPIPGMMSFEDVQLQLVDLPPIAADFFPSGMLGLIKGADGVILLADLAADSLLDDLEVLLRKLHEGRVRLRDPRVAAPAQPPAEEELEALLTRLPALLVATKADAPGAEDRLAILREAYAGVFEPLPICVETRQGLDALPGAAFSMLERIRIYAKEPGKPPDKSAPFILKRGQTAVDLAARIHRDFPERLRQARVWGSARFDGQAVPRDHALADKDVVELQIDG